MSHTKPIAQINHTIEAHIKGPEWDDVMQKTQKFMTSGIS